MDYLPKTKSNRTRTLKLVKTDKSLKTVQPDEVVCPRCGLVGCWRAGHDRYGKQTYQCKDKDCGRKFVLNPEKTRLETLNEFNFSHDVWLPEHLGLIAHPHDGLKKLNFAPIKQEWLKVNAKKLILYISSHNAFGTIYHYVASFVCFSRFICEQNRIHQIEDINRNTVVEYLSYLNRKKLSPSTIRHRLGHFSNFFITGNRNRWFEIEHYLICPEDYPPSTKSLPRYIPEEVMSQLNEHLEDLPESIMRMVLVLQETGLRVSELCQLPIDCLRNDGQQQFRIQFMRWKMKTEDTLPISSELVKVIQEQQEYIRKNLGQSFKCLFCGRRAGGNSDKFVPAPKIIKGEAFIDYIKKLAEKHNIRDASGNLWNFQAHQFRHTVGTRMINNGVPHHIIQRYLGHESPQMTMVYAHIHDKTLREEIEKYHSSRTVDFQGKIAELDATLQSSNDDLQWFKRNVQGRALEHGYCARPKVLGDCDIPGFDGCYNCPHWRTNKNFLPVLKDTLERTNKVVEKARNCGWELQAHKNIPIKNNLAKVIKTLEEDNG